jgi:prepilin-type N-terminal cleavage/methylation domain-containing protein
MLVRDRRVPTARLARAGYTLMEMLVVVAIIVVLAGIGGYYLLPKLDEAKEDADLAQSKVLTQACENYKVDKDTWPSSLQELTQPRANGNPPYVEPAALQTKCVPGEFAYDASGGHHNGLKPDIWVNGPHGQIGNWMPRVQR